MSRCGGSRISKTGASTQKGRKLKNKIEKIVQFEHQTGIFFIENKNVSQ